MSTSEVDALQSSIKNVSVETFYFFQADMHVFKYVLESIEPSRVQS